MKKKGKGRKILFLLGILLFLYWQNNGIVVNKIKVEAPRVPLNFQGYRIVHLSDLHNKSFGKNQEKLLEKIRKVKPHLIFFTGDLVDRREAQMQNSLTFMKELGKIATVYFVSGNNEWRSGKEKVLNISLSHYGVKVLHNERVYIEKGKDRIALIGIEDPSRGGGREEEKEYVKDALEQGLKGGQEKEFILLLAHRPEYMEIYKTYGIDMVFSGHAHGGQVRIPWIGGLVAPHQGFFPKYTAGRYKENSTTMIVSRGLGNSLVPQRLFNRPEIVVVTLQ